MTTSRAYAMKEGVTAIAPPWFHAAGRRIRLTRYADRRLRQRGVSKAEVLAVLSHPVGLVRSAHASSRLVFSRTVGGRRLAVVIEETMQEGVWDLVTAWDRDDDE